MGMTEIIEDLITHNSQLGKLYKEFKYDEYIELLKNKLNDEQIYEDDLDVVLYVYSTVPVDKWYEELEFSNSKEEIVQEMFNIPNFLKFKIVIKNLDEYREIHPTLDQVITMINSTLNMNSLKSFITEYYYDNILDYVQYHNIQKEYKINIEQVSLIKDIDYIAYDLSQYCEYYDKNVKQLIENEFIYQFLINHQYVLIYITVINEFDEFNLDPLQL